MPLPVATVVHIPKEALPHVHYDDGGVIALETAAEAIAQAATLRVPVIDSRAKGGLEPWLT